MRVSENHLVRKKFNHTEEVGERCWGEREKKLRERRREERLGWERRKAKEKKIQLKSKI